MNERPDLYKRFQSIVFEADTFVEFDGKLTYMKSQQDSINKVLAGLKTVESFDLFGAALKTLAETHSDSPIPLFALYSDVSEPSEELCKALEDKKNEIKQEKIKIDFDRANELYNKIRDGLYIGYTGNKKLRRYTDNHRLLENAIGLMAKYFEKDEAGNKKWNHKNPSEERVRWLIARSYLLRSKLALQKGSSVPEKKLEALRKAWICITGENKDHWKKLVSPETSALKIEIILEQYRWDPDIQKKMVIDNILCFLETLENKEFDLSVELYGLVNDVGSTLIGDDFFKSNDEKLLKVHDETSMLSLLKAKAAFRREEETLSEYLMKAVKKLDKPLSDHAWNTAIELINDVKEKSSGWEDAAIEAYEKCKEKESQIGLSLGLRWYWAKSRQLYDLAFLAVVEDDPEKAVEIADSQKSRPTIKMQAIEKFLSESDRDKFQKYVEADALASADIYVPELRDLKKVKNENIFETRDIFDVPKGWTAVHFYITEKREAHVLIVKPKNETERAIHVPIDNISDLWEAFRLWEADKREAERIPETNNTLIKLCEESGKALKPVLNKITTDKIIFIPHSFLHLIPLHASIIDDKKLFEDKKCLFLPSWSLAPLENEEAVTKDNLLICEWNKENVVKDLIESEWSNETKHTSNVKKFFDTLEGRTNPPNLLVIFSHGQGDKINPYNSGFVMKNNERLTHQALMAKLEQNSLKGSKVLLTACETDLVSGKYNPVDEHLSLANAFLRKGADEVIGNLYKCIDDISIELINEVKNSNLLKTPLYEILQKKQVEWNGDNQDNKNLYKIAVSRVIGFPKELENKNG